VQQAFRLVNNVFPARSVRTLRRGLVPGSLAYNITKSGEGNVERNVTGGSGTSAAATKSATSTLRTSRSRRMSTKENGFRNQREPNSSNGSASQGSRKPKNKSENSKKPSTQESQSYFQRPTKEQLLATATSVFHRLHIRFKWPLIRSLRPFNMDDISAFISVYLLSHAFLLIAGTTTFFLLVIATINTVGGQEYFAQFIGWYLTKESGMTVVFESAIVPKWQSKTIRFERVFVSRRPKGAEGNFVRKGSSSTAAAAAAAAAQVTERPKREEEVMDDGNYTQFDLTVESVDVTLSFVKWMNGKGLLENVEMHGVRGVVGTLSYPSTSMS
jgi:mitochondrial distribution and morphology protein 31